ncbi:MAG TPA: hypothetical protein VJ810_38475 [Blastocatellia bacterium]|nr:hypothetical protein [Blastocatellia bacterium]
MIRRTFFIMATVSMVTLVSYASLAKVLGSSPNTQTVQPQRGVGSIAPRLTVLGAEFQGQSNKPHALRVLWKVENLPAGARINRYEINVELIGNEARGTVFQTPSPSLTAVSVGLLGIPAETRNALFKNIGNLSANIKLKARFVINGVERTVETTRTGVVPN